MFNPVNRYILIELATAPNPADNSLIVLPEGYKAAEERFITVVAMKAAADVRFNMSVPSKLIVDRSMIEEISIEGTNYNVILDNYVIGIID
tara:strand:- start:6606 stop:6878 length:273 start_codon:yes stop_codon:yes gene_type:complete